MNTQPIEKYIAHKDGTIEIVDLWHTIQGEGVFVGQPAIFVRLAGCTLRCPSCDSDYTTNRNFISADDILAFASNYPNTRLIVFTGGEPLRQSLAAVIHQIQRRFIVQIETNGTLNAILPGMRKLDTQIGLPPDEHLWFVCSPKTPKIDENLAPCISCYKYVLSADAIDPNDGLPTSALQMPGSPYRPTNLAKYVQEGRVYLQPCDDGTAFRSIQSEEYLANQKACVQSCLKYGYRMCIQLHKLIGLP